MHFCEITKIFDMKNSASSAPHHGEDIVHAHRSLHNCCCDESAGGRTKRSDELGNDGRIHWSGHDYAADVRALLSVGLGDHGFDGGGRDVLRFDVVPVAGEATEIVDHFDTACTTSGPLQKFGPVWLLASGFLNGKNAPRIFHSLMVDLLTLGFSRASFLSFRCRLSRQPAPISLFFVDSNINNILLKMWMETWFESIINLSSID